MTRELPVLNFALVGCGRIAKRHAELLGLKQINGARLAAVCDVNAERAKAFGDKFKVPFYTNSEDMVRREKGLDALSILTPSGLHAEHVRTLAPYKKHLIVEKPMALTLDDADDMIRVSSENGIKLFVIKQNRFNVPVRKLRQALENGRFGKPVLGTVRVRWCRTQDYYDSDPWRGTWALDGGVFANQASHHVDLLEWMMGDVESVFAKAATVLADIETEDTGVAVLKFKSGALGVIEATTATRPNDLEGSISILGEKGTVEIGGFAVNQIKVWRFVDQNEEDRDVLDKYSVNPPNVYGFGHQMYYEHVVDCIVNDKKALVDGFEGRRSLELISAIYESVETGKEVPLRFVPHKCRLGIR